MPSNVSVLTVFFAGALLVASTYGIARAADADIGARTPQQVLAHHIAVGASGDLDAVMSDYADDAVLMTPAGVTRGKAAIRALFARLNPEPGASVRPVRQTLQEQFTSNVAWLMSVQNAGKPNEMRSVETFLIHDGKITVQTVGMVNVQATSAAH